MDFLNCTKMGDYIHVKYRNYFMVTSAAVLIVSCCSLRTLTQKDQL